MRVIYILNYNKYCNSIINDNSNLQLYLHISDILYLQDTSLPFISLTSSGRKMKHHHCPPLLILRMQLIEKQFVLVL
jgi:hypothetical protein